MRKCYYFFWRCYFLRTVVYSVLLIACLLAAKGASATVFPVTNGNDAGAGSLRQAIISANAGGPGPHAITFSITGVINLASALPAITNAGITIDGGNNITISANVADVDRDVLSIGAGGNNTVIKNLILQNTGGEGIYIGAALSGVTIDNVTIRHTVNDYINHGIYVASTATNMTIRKVTMTDIQDGYWGIRFIGAVNGLTVDSFKLSAGSGTTARGIQFQGVATNVTIKNSTIDLDDPATTDDGDYGVYFNTNVTGLVIDSSLIRDAEVYGVFVGGVGANVQIKHTTFDNLDGGAAAQQLRFAGRAATVLIDSVTFDLDQRNTTNDGDYGINFVGDMQGVTIQKSTFKEADVNGIYSAGLNNDNITITNNLFEKNGLGSGVDGGIQFVGVRNTTSDGGPVVFSNNTFRDNNGVSIYLRPGNGGNYLIPNLTLSNNTISGTKSTFGAIRVNYIDKIIISQNSIYNNIGKGIELSDGTLANCGYEGINTPQLLSSTETSAGSGVYNISVKMPAICGTGGCALQLFSNEAGVKGIGGQHYIQTFTGLSSGIQTLTGVTSAFPEMTSAPYGTFTATLRVTANNCGTSEFSNRIAVKVNGPAGVDAGIQLWLNPDYTDPGNMVNGIGWEDFSGNNKHFGMVFGDPVRTDGGLNFNHAINFDGDDHLRSAASPFANKFPAGEAIAVTKALANNVNRGNPYDFGSGSRASHYTWGNAAVYNGFGTNDRFGWNPLTKAILDAKPGITVASITGTPIDVRKWNIYGTHSGAGNWGVNFNGGQQSFNTSTNTINFTLAAGNEHVGAVSGTVFAGDIAEEILYNRVLTTLERQRINSYLAIKYGLTLFQNYVASNGTTTWWDLSANTGYNKGIAGLARDATSILHQKQSRSISADDVVTIGVGSVLYSTNEDNDGTIKNDRSAFIWGTDSASVLYNTPYITTYSDARMTRVWKVQKTNWFDTTIIIKVKGGNANRTLLVSADPTFASGVANYPLNDTGAVILNSNILGNGMYFTFANKIAAPACVTNGIQAWYRADDNNASASAWTDYSGYDRNAVQPTAANQPVRVSNSINFNPAFDFDGSNDYLNIAHNLTIAGTNPFTIVSVTKRGTVGTSDMILGQQSDATNTFSHYFSTGNKYATGPINVGSVTSTGTYSVANIPYLNATTRAVNLFSLYTNGATDGTGTQPYNFLAINQRIGWRGGGTTDYFDGNISELVVYNRPLSATELLQVNSYLALKYGITLNNGTSDYIASNGATKMWDAAANTVYNKDIAGIGKDTCGNLHQKQSRSVNAGSLVTMALGDVVAPDNKSNAFDVTNNLSFFTWGDNGSATTYATNVSGANVTLRMARIWKVDKTNWADQEITIKLNGSARNTYLLISSDATFAAIDQEIALNDDSTITINSSLLPDGAYFTFGKQILGPGYVNSGVQMWLRADDGLAAGDAWYDFSGNATDASQPAVTNQPAFQQGIINFNPAFKFDGTDDYLQIPQASITGKFSFGNAARTLVMVGTPLSNATDQAPFTYGTFVANQASGFRRTTLQEAVFEGQALANNVMGPANSFPISRPSLIGGRYTGGASGTASLYANGTTAVASAVRNWNTLNSAQGAMVGKYVGENRQYNGHIGEVIVYNRNVTTVEYHRISSYLALKYGLTLSQTTPTDYVATDWDGTTGTKMWTASKNTGYGFRIAGIGRDELTRLNQKQSRSAADANAIITIAAGTAIAADNPSNAATLDDLSFFTWSDNNLATTFTVPVTGVPNATARLARVWKVDRTNWTDQDITIQADKNGVRYLLVNATDPAFGAGTTEYAFNTTTSTVTINTTDLPDGAYFTLATRISGPGCVNNGVLTWLRADYNSSGSLWADFSGNQVNATQATAANQPQLVDSGMNYNPSLNLDGTADFLSANMNINPATANPITTFTVYKADAASANTRALWGNDNGGFDRFMKLESASGNEANAAFSGGNIIGKALINSAVMNDGPANGSFVYINNRQVLNFTQANSAGGLTTTSIGNWGNGGYFDGKIAEQVFYNRALDATERLRVNSYLALKYGITLDQTTPTDYVASDWNGTTGMKMWTAADNTGYNYRITGIGRDDCDELHQKQSRNQDGGLVTVAIGSVVAATNTTNTDTIVANNSYLVFADNNLDTTYSVPITASGLVSTVHTPRIWKVDKTNWTDADITFKYHRNASRVYLLISTDPTFATGVQELAINADDSLLNFSSDMLPDGVYFTFGKEIYGPGYVNNGIRLWMRADQNITAGSAGSAVTGWEDYSGNEILFQQNGANPLPLLETRNAQFNFNPSLDFVSAGAEQMIALNSGDLVTPATFDHYSMFMAIVKDGTAAQRPFSMINNGGNNYVMDVNTSGRAGLTFEYENGVAIPANQTRLLGVTNGGTAATQRGYHNGKMTVDNTTTTSTMSDVLAGTAELGAANGSAAFGGHMGEVIVYNRQVTPDEALRINAYLALKYGVTLDQTTPNNYVASNWDGSTGTIYWDATANTGYNNNIAGLGRDDSTSLLQKQSRSVNTVANGNMVAIGLGSIDSTNQANTGSFTDDLSFLVWGDNGLTGTKTTEYPVTELDPNGCSKITRLQREWKVQETGTVGFVQVQFYLAGLIPNSATISDLTMLVDDDGDFSNGGTTVVSPAAYDAATQTVSFNDVDFTNTQYFTLVTDITNQAPGGVITNLYTWYRADKGVTTATGVSQWDDQSASVKNVTQATNQPAYNTATGLINFNPALTFDGANDVLSNAAFSHSAAASGEDIFAVVLPNAATGPRNVIGLGNATAGQGTELRFNGNVLQYASKAAGTIQVIANGSVNTSGLVQLANANRDNAGAASLLLNGASVSTGTISQQPANTALNIGARRNAATPDQFFTGRIAEVAIYNRQLTAPEREKVASYLAIKYGITLPHNYTYPDGTIVWDQAANTGYGNNITGIGRDDCNGLHQKQSKSINASALVTVGSGTAIETSNTDNLNILENNSALLFGDNNGDISTWASTEAPGGRKRIAREWKAQLTGTTTTVTIQVPANTGASAVKLPAEINKVYLLVDADGDFSSGSTEVEMVLNGTNYEAAYEFTTSGYFTFATGAAGLELQVKALLQGAWNGTAMRTDLKTAGVLPATDPYGQNTTPSVSPNATAASVVDWVLVELRDNASPATVLASRAALLLADGSVADTNYVQPLTFYGINTGNYNVAIRHRNHLGIMSLNAVDFSSGAGTIDFSSSSTATYGSYAQKELSSGVMGLWAGNVNTDQSVRHSAKPSDGSGVQSAVLTHSGNTTGAPGYTGFINAYSLFDVNLDGRVYYTAAPSDRDIIVNNVTTHPANVFGLASFVIMQQLP